MRTEASQAEAAVEAAKSEAAEEVRDGFFKHSSFVSHRVANDHDSDEIFGLDCPIPTDYRPIIGQILVGVVL